MVGTGPEVGAGVGRVVGALVGTMTGPWVGPLVGAPVGDVVGPEVGAAVASEPPDPPAGSDGVPSGTGLGRFDDGAGVAPGSVEGWLAGEVGRAEPRATGPAVADGAGDRTAV